jgi:hypothetical protein
VRPRQASARSAESAASAISPSRSSRWIAWLQGSGAEAQIAGGAFLDVQLDAVAVERAAGERKENSEADRRQIDRQIFRPRHAPEYMSLTDM